MNIYVMDTENQILRVKFTEEEIKHPLFGDSVKRVGETLTTQLEDNELHITPTPKEQSPNIGLLVDSIRETFQGDVVREYEEKETIITPAELDSKGKITKPAITTMEKVEVAKDLSECPVFKFTENEQLEVDVKVENGEGKLQNTIQSVSRDAL